MRLCIGLRPQKLGFSNVYNKFLWNFSFQAIQRMDISEEFTRWVKLLFGNASTAININSSHAYSFKVEKGFRQGCPLCTLHFFYRRRGPYTQYQESSLRGEAKIDHSLGGRKQYSLSQYWDDSSFMVRGNKQFIDEYLCLSIHWSFRNGK